MTTNNYAQLGGITKWAVIHACGEGNMVGLAFVNTSNFTVTQTQNPINSNPPAGQVLANWSYMDDFFDSQRNGNIYQACQQANYAASPGTGSLPCNYANQIIPAANPLQCGYNAYGPSISTPATYQGNNPSPAMSYAQAVAASLPSGTGVIIAPTMNFCSGSTGIQSWQAGASNVAVGSGQAPSLFTNVLGVLGRALSVPGAYLHSHLMLFGEIDMAAAALSQDQFSYYTNRFFAALTSRLGYLPVPIVAGAPPLAYVATQPGGVVGNVIYLSLKGIQNRYRLANFVDAVINPAVGISGGNLVTDATTPGAQYFGGPSLRTYGLNLFNYGFTQIPVMPVSYVPPPITGLTVASTSTTNLILSWNPSFAASAYDFMVQLVDNTTGAPALTQNTFGVDGLTISGLTFGRSYTSSVVAINDFGVSTTVSSTNIVGNGDSINFALSTMVVTNSPQQANGTSTITITATFKNNNNAPVIGIASGTLVVVGGNATSVIVTPAGSSSLGASQTTNSSGVVSWTVTSTNIITQNNSLTFGLTSFSSFPTGTMVFIGVSPSASSLTTSATPQPADGATTITITATFVDAVGNPFLGYTTSPLLLTSGLHAQVYITPGTRGSNGSAQAVNGAGVATWVMKSGDVFLGNNFICTMSGISQTQGTIFNSVVAAANVDWIVLGDVTNSQPVTLLPFWSTTAGVSAVTNNSGSGQPALTYVSDTINGVTKSWMDTTAVPALGNNRACWEVHVTPTTGGVSQNFSFSLWMKPTSVGSVVRGIVIGSTSFVVPSAGNHTWYANYSGANTFTGHIMNVFGQNILTPWPTTLTMVAGTWYHMVITYQDSITTINVYLNGNQTPVITTALVGSPGAGSFNPAPNSFTSFCGQSTSNPGAAGRFADIVQYNTVLTPSQVTAVYNSYFLNP